MQQHGSKYFVRRPLLPPPPPPPPPPDPRVGSIGHNSAFLQNMVIKCSNMVANILPADPYPTP